MYKALNVGLTLQRTQKVACISSWTIAIAALSVIIFTQHLMHLIFQVSLSLQIRILPGCRRVRCNISICLCRLSQALQTKRCTLKSLTLTAPSEAARSTERFISALGASIRIRSHALSISPARNRRLGRVGRAGRFFFDCRVRCCRPLHLVWCCCRPLHLRHWL